MLKTRSSRHRLSPPRRALHVPIAYSTPTALSSMTPSSPLHPFPLPRPSRKMPGSTFPIHVARLVPLRRAKLPGLLAASQLLQALHRTFCVPLIPIARFSHRCESHLIPCRNNIFICTPDRKLSRRSTRSTRPEEIVSSRRAGIGARSKIF